MNSAGGGDDDGLNAESETPLTWFDAQLGAAEETLDCWILPRGSNSQRIEYLVKARHKTSPQSWILLGELKYSGGINHPIKTLKPNL